uniref:Uncharacterized protein n=1 Tax=Anguilla anguilla TaxID=7936 RepID=A0A0E9X6C4_ANGAN
MECLSSEVKVHVQYMFLYCSVMCKVIVLGNPFRKTFTLHSSSRCSWSDLQYNHTIYNMRTFSCSHMMYMSNTVRPG